MAKDRMLSDEILLALIKKNSGGGGGTKNYNDLSNQPQIGGVTLQGNKTASDLGLASEEDLEEKQDVLTAGNYVSITNDGTINVTKAIGVYDRVRYVFTPEGGGYYMRVEVYINDVKRFEQQYQNTAVFNHVVIMDLIEFWYGGDGYYWHYKTLIDSREHAKDIVISWYYTEMDVHEETFDVPQDDSTTLATKGDVEDAIDTIKDGQNIDSFADVESALELKQDTTDNNLDTDAKTIVGAINEHEGDIGSLKSGLTNLDNEVNGDATTYPYADVITIPDAVPANLADCTVKIEPVQDLHGQSAPYVGGAGKNKLPLTLTGIKANNVYGTWNDNVYTLAGVTYTVYTDDGGNVTGIKVNGTYNGSGTYLSFWIPGDVTLPAGTYVYSSGMTATQANLRIRCNDGAFFAYTTNEMTKTYEADTHIDIEIVLNQGDTVENAMLYPMIRLSTETDTTFAPYTNICPITGHTESVVTRNGVNLLNPTKFARKDPNSGDASNNWAIWEDYIRCNYNDSLTLNCGIGHVQIYRIIVSCFDKYMNRLGNISETYIYGDGYTFKINIAGTKYCRVQLYNANSMADYDFSTAQLEYGSTATPYVPYAGKTYTIALGDTIYGGTVDFDSGVMTVTRKCVDLGSLDFTYDENQRFTIAISDMKRASIRAAHFITSCYLTIDDGRPYSQVPDFSAYAGWDGTAMMLSIHDSRYSDAETYKTAITGQTICYELATPTTIQLTPQQIQLLKGQNTLTASTGQISVTVNGVSGAIGQVQTQANATDEALAELAADIAAQLPTAPTTDGAYVLTVTVADGTPTYSWESAE